MEEDDAEVGAVVVAGHDVAAVHVCVPAGLVDEKATDVVEPLERVPPPLEHRRAFRCLHPADDDPERLAARVVVDGADHAGDARRCRLAADAGLDPTDGCTRTWSSLR